MAFLPWILPWTARRPPLTDQTDDDAPIRQTLMIDDDKRKARDMQATYRRAVRRGGVALLVGLLTVIVGGAHASAQTMGTLKVCKVLAAGTTAPAGTLFTFTVSGGTGTISVAPGTCALLTVTPGDVRVTETESAGFTVAAIAFVAGTGTTDVATRSATAIVAADAALTTEVQFTNAGSTSTGGGAPTATPELGSGELVATGVLPLGAVLLYRRRRARGATRRS